MKQLIKKICAALLVQSILFAGMGMTPIYAQWPDEGYVLVPEEDMEFATCQEGVDYGNAHGWDMYNKYNKRNQWEVVRNEKGTFTLHWYIYGGVTK